MYGLKFRIIFIKYKSKNHKDLSFQIEEKMLLKIDFSCDSFPKLPSQKTHEHFSFTFLNAFFTVVINYGHCNSLCFRFSIYNVWRRDTKRGHIQCNYLKSKMASSDRFPLWSKGQFSETSMLECPSLPRI